LALSLSSLFPSWSLSPGCCPASSPLVDSCVLGHVRPGIIHFHPPILPWLTASSYGPSPFLPLPPALSKFQSLYSLHALGLFSLNGLSLLLGALSPPLTTPLTNPSCPSLDDLFFRKLC
jgi:hypothetical protein